MKRLLIILLILSVSITLIPSCNSPATTNGETPTPDTADSSPVETPSEEKSTLDTCKTYFSRSYPSFNYFGTAYGTVREIVTNSIDTLVEPDIYGLYQPSLAESWSVNEDFTVWTFHIRKDIKWVDHTGEQTDYDVTAEDFVDGIRYIGDPLNGAYSLRVVRNLIHGLYDYYWTLDDIDNGEITDQNREDVLASFDEMVGVKALDEYTLEYTLDYSTPYFLSLIESSMLLLPVEYEYAVSLGEDFGVDNEHMLYCGAYYISDFQRDKAITLTKNPHYWDIDQVTLSTVEYQIIPDGTTSLEMFKRGEIHYTTVESEEYLSLQNTEWADKLIPNEFSFSTNYLWLDFVGDNAEFRTFIQNENFRKALRCAVNSESIASLREPVDPDRLIRNTINAEEAIFDTNGIDYTDYEPLKAIKEARYFDAAQARTYMEKAIEELCDSEGNILGVEPATVDYLPVIKTDIDAKLPVTIVYVGTDDESEIIMAQLIEAMVEDAIGQDYVDVVLAFDTSGSFYDTVGGSNDGPFNYDIYWDSLSTGYADPSGILTRITSDGAENVGDYDVPEYDALIEKALNAKTFEERLQEFANAEAFLLEKAYIIPVISSLRGYHLSYEVPYTAPRSLYGNHKYKGALVLSEPLTREEYQSLTDEWEKKQNEAYSHQ